MNARIVQIAGAGDGGPTPYDGQYVVAWNPHTYFGTADLTTTPDRAAARVFDDVVQLMEEYRAVSRVQALRPTDGKPNRPLTALTIVILHNTETQEKPH